MNTPHSRRHPRSGREHVIAGGCAGVIAAVAYATEQEFDLRAFHHNADDLILVGGLVTQDRDRARLLGMLAHLVNGATLGAAYARFAHNRLPGPPVVRGITFALAETTLLYPFALLEDHHTAVQKGILDRYLTRSAFAQAILRHVAFGAVLGVVTDRLLRR